MFFANYILKDRLTKIINQNKNMKLDNNLLDSEKAKFIGVCYDMNLALNELYVATEEHDYIRLTTFIQQQLDDINIIDEIADLSNILDTVISRFENIDFNSRISTYRNYNYYKCISKDYIKSIARNITTDREFNVFDTKCNIGTLMATIKEIKPNAICYGLEDDNDKAEKAKKIAKRVIKGQIKGSRIKNEAFDFVVTAPSIKQTLEENMAFGSVVKEERSYLQSVVNYVAPNGVIIIGLPYYRLYKDMCMFIARNFYNVTIVQGIDKEINLHMVYIVGQRSTNIDLNEDTYELLRKAYKPSNILSAFEVILPKYNLSNKLIEIDLFKGSVLDMEELYNIVEASGCMSAFLDKQKVANVNENTKRPLLPFNVGQIGLVLTSGCLDGIIDEGNGHYHLVKGRVSKKSQVTREISDGVMEEKEVISNRVEINVVLPNGDFKTLG